MNKIKKFKFVGGLKLFTVILTIFSLICLSGCETLKKKFIRKHKGEPEEEKGVVFEPQEYPSQQFSNIELYQNNYLLWKSWKQELSDSLQEGVNRKKQIENAKEMVVNLEAMKSLLQEDKQKALGLLIQNAQNINDKIADVNLNSTDLTRLKQDLETLEKNVRKDFSYKKVKDFIKK